MTGIITLYILSLAPFCQGGLYISTRESYWAKASSHCSMATPKLTPTPAGYSVDVHDIELSDDEAVWIGYYRDFGVFEYMDCVKLGVLLEMNKSLQSLDIESSPDQCFPGCGHSSIIGVTQSKCYCIGENYSKKSRETNCTTPCLYPPGAACGDKNGSYVSVYRLNKNASMALLQDTDSADDSEANCLSFNLHSREFMWENCRQSLQFECYTGHQAIFGREICSWLEAADRCFQLRLSPTSFENSVSLTNRSRTFVWTGLLRSQRIHQHDGNSFVLDKWVFWETRFGFLTKTSTNEYLLKFETDSTTRRILCQTFEPFVTKDWFWIVFGVIPVISIGAVVASVIVFYIKGRMGNRHSQQSNICNNLELHDRETATNDDVSHANDDNITGVQDYVMTETKRNGSRHSDERISETENSKLDIRTGECTVYG